MEHYRAMVERMSLVTVHPDASSASATSGGGSGGDETLPILAKPRLTRGRSSSARATSKKTVKGGRGSGRLRGSHPNPASSCEESVGDGSYCKVDMIDTDDGFERVDTSAKEDPGVTIVSVDELDDEVMRDKSCETIPDISDDDVALQRAAYEEAVASYQKLQHAAYEEAVALVQNVPEIVDLSCAESGKEVHVDVVLPPQQPVSHVTYLQKEKEIVRARSKSRSKSRTGTGGTGGNAVPTQLGASKMQESATSLKQIDRAGKRSLPLVALSEFIPPRGRSSSRRRSSSAGSNRTWPSNQTHGRSQSRDATIGARGDAL